MELCTVNPYSRLCDKDSLPYSTQKRKLKCIRKEGRMLKSQEFEAERGFQELVECNLPLKAMFACVNTYNYKPIL